MILRHSAQGDGLASIVPEINPLRRQLGRRRPSLRRLVLPRVGHGLSERVLCGRPVSGAGRPPVDHPFRFLRFFKVGGAYQSAGDRTGKRHLERR